MKNWTFILLFFLFAIACGKDDDSATSIDWGYDYYPAEVGYWLEYEVDSIFYDDFTDPVTIDTANYCMREEFESVFQDLSGEDNFRIEQYKKNDTASAWILDKIVSSKVTTTNFQKVENDLRFIPLVFPVKTDKSWDGLIYLNVQDEPTLEYYDDTQYPWGYRYTEVNVSKQLGNFSFDSCVVVAHIDDENLFEKKYSQEIYAKGVGLVYKEMIVLKTQAPPNGQPFLDRAESGFIIKQTIKNYPQ